MLQYNIVSGILLILSITNFALAVPVQVQEKRQPSADVVDVPRDGIPVFEKRGGEMLEQLTGYLERLKDPHASSGSAPAGPEHGSINDVQASKPPNPEPSPQENSVANGPHVGGVQPPKPGPSPQEKSVANGHQVDPGPPNPSKDFYPWYSLYFGE